MGFTSVNVFDVSQTKGKELANLRVIIRDDIKDNHRAAELYNSLYNHIGKKMDIRESADDFKDQPKARGYYDRVNNAIRINSNVENTTMKLKTLIHEYAHAQLHRMDSPLKDLPKKHKEAQAEATAFMVNKILWH